MNVSHIFKQYAKGELLAPLSDRVKPVKQPGGKPRDFSQASVDKILASLVYGQGMLISDICNKSNLCQTRVRVHCKYLRTIGEIKGQRVNENQAYGLWAYYHADDENIPPSINEQNESAVLGVIAKFKSILTADIQRQTGLTQYSVRKATTALEGQGKIKRKNIAKSANGQRVIWEWSLK